MVRRKEITMLKSIRIEVEEETADRCVESLWKYEHGIQVIEAQRWCQAWPIMLSSEGSPESPEEQYGIRLHPWEDDVMGRGEDPWPRSFFNEQLGRELVEEVIEYDESIPAFRGRRVVRYTRIDTRSLKFVPLKVEELPTFASVGTGTSGDMSHIRDVLAQVEVRK
jgi:hypothetical protein